MYVHQIYKSLYEIKRNLFVEKVIGICVTQLCSVVRHESHKYALKVIKLINALKLNDNKH